MPKRDRKMTLRERADRWTNVAVHEHDGLYASARDAFIAGAKWQRRADRVTKAERAVVEAAVRYVRDVRDGNPKQSLNPLGMAVVALERAKGRK